jgi:hypothetical protein
MGRSNGVYEDVTIDFLFDAPLRLTTEALAPARQGVSLHVHPSSGSLYLGSG